MINDHSFSKEVELHGSRHPFIQPFILFWHSDKSILLKFIVRIDCKK
jgi:hypothetical protein